MFRIGLVSDISQAFLNIAIAKEHKDYLRFLWYDRNNQLLIYRFKRVVFGINSSPFLLNATIRHHMDKYLATNKVLTDKFMEDLYADDSTTGVNSVEEGIAFYNFTKASLKEGGFDLKKWYSNSSDLIDYINSQEVGGKRAEVEEVSYAKTLFPNNSDDRKVLGVVWDGLRDVLVFNAGDIIEEALRLPVSKRSVLSIGKVLRPLGINLFHYNLCKNYVPETMFGQSRLG